jgi:hypothetical protein
MAMMVKRRVHMTPCMMGERDGRFCDQLYGCTPRSVKCNWVNYWLAEVGAAYVSRFFLHTCTARENFLFLILF